MNYAVAAGYATFAVDVVGAGDSSHPAGSQVTIFSAAEALHHVITKLRAGAIGSVAFSKVIWVGHSMGSAAGWAEISRYHDVDAFIATGAPHTLSLATLGSAIIIPASQDPKFAPLGLDSNYISLPESDRSSLFYYAPTTDPQAFAVDYANRDAFTIPALNTGNGLFLEPASTAITRNVNVPVLDIFGEHDPLFCAPDAYDCSNYSIVKQNEMMFYPNATSFDMVIVPSTGHDLNTHMTAPYSYATMLSWALGHIAP
ncbi:hypothetical protein A6A27_39650 [Micromonospora sp. CB01531]|nr:hypothetical protein A6A27_39650 [Micromonospora sp. CB01531]